MAVEALLRSHTFLAGADLSAKQYHFVKQSTTPWQVVACSVQGEYALGVLQDDPDAAGKAANVALDGSITKVYAGGSVTAGDAVMTSTAGRALTRTSTNAILGTAITSGSSGELITILLSQMGTQARDTNSVISIPITLANVADGDVVTTWTPGFAGTISAVNFLVTSAVTTGSKGTTLNLEIGTTNLTGGVVTLTSANCTPLGKVIAGTAVTGNNAFGASDTISVEAASTTAFVEGAGVLLISVS